MELVSLETLSVSWSVLNHLRLLDEVLLVSDVDLLIFLDCSGLSGPRLTFGPNFDSRLVERRSLLGGSWPELGFGFGEKSIMVVIC